MIANAPELAQQLAKLYNAYGPPSIHSIEEAIFPVVLVGDLRPRGKGGLFSQYDTAVAVAAQNSVVYLINPLGSRVRTVLRTISSTTAATANILVVTGNVTTIPSSAGGVLGQGMSRFLTRARCGTRATSVAVLEGVTSFGFASSLTATQPTDALRDIALEEGDVLGFMDGTVNQQLTMGLLWEEFPLP